MTDTMTTMTTFLTRVQINGEYRDGSAGAEFAVHCPSDGRELAQVADATVDDALMAVEAAAAAADGWKTTSPRDRAEMLRRAYEIMTARSEEVALTISLENGKSLTDARNETAYAAEFFRWYAEEAVRLEGHILRAPSGANDIVATYEPVGVAMLVTPWNFPAAMATRKLAPALAAGCTAILKPAKETPLTALLIGQILAEAGAPAGTVNIIPTTSAGRIVSRILADDRVRILSFTGSTEVGRVLLAEAAKTVVRPAMELGGNAPFVVLDDANLADALNGAMVAKLRNGGQACTAANRFLVHDSIAEAFGLELAARFDALTVGPGHEEATDIGPLVNQESVDKVRELVDDAIARGARRITQRTEVPAVGHFYPPTVLVEVPADAKIIQEEIFGPVAAIATFADEAEAISRANDTIFGLISYVYSADLGRAMRVARAFDSGMVAVNRGVASDAAAPFGGSKQSGLGREGAHEGVLEYLEQKYIAVDW
jgi:succinate-semialdehyde dehydrogenase / glutarate-semialdehyde dehydrogenase